MGELGSGATRKRLLLTVLPPRNICEIHLYDSGVGLRQLLDSLEGYFAGPGKLLKGTSRCFGGKRRRAARLLVDLSLEILDHSLLLTYLSVGSIMTSFVRVLLLCVLLVATCAGK